MMSHTSVTSIQSKQALSSSLMVERLVKDAHPAPAAVFIVAHQDDEIIGAGTRLGRLRQAMFVHVTDGSPRDQADASAQGFSTREEYAEARRRELYNALSWVGIGPEQCRELGIADQEASLHMAELPRRMAALIDELRPEVIITHPYEGGHPDHDATAFAIHAAIALTERDGGHPPALVEMTCYHNSAAGIETGTFLPGPIGCEETVVRLTPAEQELKRKMLAQFATQQGTLQYFRSDEERLRPAPKYDFTEPPHAGELFYEKFSWGMTSERFRRLAREAMEALGLTGAM